MTIQAVAVKNLYDKGKIDMTGVKRAVTMGIISAEEYTEITGQGYVKEE